MSANPVADLENVWLPRGQSKILDVLAEAYPRRVSTETLVSRVYADDPNGGPLNALQTIRTQIHKIRQTLPKYGWTIPHNSAGRDAAHRCYYVLARVDNV